MTTDKHPKLNVKQVTIDCINPKKLSAFYSKLLDWEVEYEDENFVRIVSGIGNFGLGFQYNEDYIPPVWPEETGKQQQMEHLDIYVETEEEMGAAVEYAIACGASRAKVQYSDGWTVMIDPEGHPFCIDLL